MHLACGRPAPADQARLARSSARAIAGCTPLRRASLLVYSVHRQLPALLSPGHLLARPSAVCHTLARKPLLPLCRAPFFAGPGCMPAGPCLTIGPCPCRITGDLRQSLKHNLTSFLLFVHNCKETLFTISWEVSPAMPTLWLLYNLTSCTRSAGGTRFCMHFP